MAEPNDYLNFRAAEEEYHDLRVRQVEEDLLWEELMEREWWDIVTGEMWR